MAQNTKLTLTSFDPGCQTAPPPSRMKNVVPSFLSGIFFTWLLLAYGPILFGLPRVYGSNCQ